MILSRARTPGIWMTEQQFLNVLDDLHVVRVRRPEGGKITLTVAGETGEETLTVSDLKSKTAATLAELEDLKREIQENQFASPLESEITTRDQQRMRVRYAKRDEQLTSEEGAEKLRLLREVDAGISRYRRIIGGMNYLQIHYRELQPTLTRRDMPLGALLGVREEGRQVWTKGIKSAANYCIKEAAKPANVGRSAMEICREFLQHYVLQGEEEYSAEQLHRNIQQILRLDRTD
jgi:hypothetical protein